MPLNEKLYRSLIRAFGNVKLARESERMRWTTRRDPRTSREYGTPVKGYAGEYYRVCCPFCKEERYRLWINHRWNTIDDTTGVIFGKGLCICFNDGCDLNDEAPREARRKCQDKLEEYMKPYVGSKLRLRITPRLQAALDKVAKLPEKVVPLQELKGDHKAIRYLFDRGFEPYQTAVDWSLSYCWDDQNPNVADRIIIPIFKDGKLVGWQARFIGEPPASHIPKYYTMPGTPKNRLLYNQERAAGYDFGIIVEGVTDVWNVGFNAVAVLGSSISGPQLALAKAAWGLTGVGLLFDPVPEVDLASLSEKKRRGHLGKVEAYNKAFNSLKDGGFQWGALEIRLPEHRDPGSVKAVVLRDYLTHYAKLAAYPHQVVF